MLPFIVISVCLFVDSLLVRGNRFSTSPSQMIKFTLTDFTTRSLYDAQIIYITTVMITAAIICHCAVFIVFLDCLHLHGICRQNKKPLNEGNKQTMWSYTASAQ